ncbi:MAG: hypothetical protein FWD25_03235 [Clostridia bacterium]|nr:hypothetical protein [Clostridia bacterium]
MKTMQLSKVKDLVLDNIVVILFAALVIFGISTSGGGLMGNFSIYFQTLFRDLLVRVFRNSFLVMSLVIPVIAGLGLNFGIVVGAIAGQTALIFLRYMGHYYPALGGISGFFLALLLALPLAVMFGWLTGKLYNKVRGQEMIAGLIVSFFAAGLYNFVFMFAVGYIIPVDGLNPIIIPENSQGIAAGVRMTVDLGTIRGSIDSLIQIPLLHLILVLSIVMKCYFVYKHVRAFNKTKGVLVVPAASMAFIIALVVLGALNVGGNIAAILGLLGIVCLLGLLIYFCLAHKRKNPDQAPAGTTTVIFTSVMAAVLSLWAAYNIFLNTGLTSPLAGRAPVVTALFSVALFLFTGYLMKTKLGQDFRAVGQNQHIAEVAGINVNKTRIIATILSTVFAAWGMIIFLQNMGTMSVYESHRNIGLFAVASILVGGASTSRASLRNVIVGVILFNAMAIVAPDIGRYVFGEPVMGEYFRSFMQYAAIGLALGLYAWRAIKASQNQNTL